MEAAKKNSCISGRGTKAFPPPYPNPNPNPNPTRFQLSGPLKLFLSVKKVLKNRSEPKYFNFFLFFLQLLLCFQLFVAFSFFY